MAVNAAIYQTFEHATNPDEFGIPPCACADVHFPPFSSAQANLSLILPTAASEYNKINEAKGLYRTKIKL